jgi:sugar lactone lactonase YvrE
MTGHVQSDARLATRRELLGGIARFPLLAVAIGVATGTDQAVASTQQSPGSISTLAGGGLSRSALSPARSVLLVQPWAVASGTTGAILLADSGRNQIMAIRDGTVSVVAGTGEQGFSGDSGPAINAKLSFPTGVAVSPVGELFIADNNNARIRKVDLTGNISTVAGSGVHAFGGDGGPATRGQLAYPTAVAVDDRGNLYIADTNNYRIRKVNAAGIMSTAAGSGIEGFSGDGGLAVAAKMGQPTSITVDKNGSFFVADIRNGRVRRISAAGIITTVAGSGMREYGGDGGPAFFGRRIGRDLWCCCRPQWESLYQ